jgi:DnaJ-class molecular chaperone
MNSGVKSTKKRNHQEDESTSTKPKTQTVKNCQLFSCDHHSTKSILQIIKNKNTSHYNIIVVDVTYEESLKGCTKRITFERLCLCPCVTLSGDKNKRIKRTEKNYSSVVCELCEGFTMLTQPQQESISIPTGIKNGMFQIIDGLGDYRPQGTAGDLIVVFKVEEHPDFIREGNDAILTILLPQTSLEQENPITIPTLYRPFGH